jgi:hypothetical protein
MLDKKVFSFVEFVNESYYNQNTINEEKTSFIPSKEDIIKVLEIQEKLKANFKGKKGDKKAIQIWGSLEAFNSLSEDLQAKAIADIQKSFEKLNISEKRYNKVLSLLEAELKKGGSKALVEYGGTRQYFYIIVTKEEIQEEVEPEKKPVEEPKPERFSVIDPTKTSYFFKNNMYEIKEDNLDESFVDPEYTKQVLDLIDQKMFEAFNYYASSGKIGITKIDIETSCSRYRNSGPAESLSWAELAYKRAGVFSKFIKASAEKASNNDKEFVDGILGVTKLGYFGSNGDGTSGPDPEKNSEGQKVRRGYYIKDGDKSKFVDAKGDDLTMINVVDVQIGENASPVLGTKVNKVKAKDDQGNVMEKIPASSKEYDPFKYIQITMEGLFGGGDKTGAKDIPEPEPQIISKEDYSVSIRFPRKMKRSIPPRKPRTGRPPGKPHAPNRKGGGKNKAVACPIWD